MKNIKVSIIIVNYKAGRFLKDCLKSIGKNESWEIIVVDNSRQNVGYGAGCNLGAKKAKGEYLFFLNPDTIILPRAIERMTSFLDKKREVGVLGPRLFNNFKKENQLSFCRFPDPFSSVFIYSPLKSFWPTNPFWNNHIYQKFLKTTQPIMVDAVSGAALMVRSDIFWKVGGFDERFFLYFEENDLCRRIQKIGKKIIFFPGAQIIHLGRKSTFNLAKATKDFQKSRYYFFKKYFGALIALLLETFIRLLEKVA